MIKLENLKEILRKFTVEKNCRLYFQNYCGKWDGEVAIYPLKKHSSILGLLGLVYLSTSILGTTFALISNIKFKNFFFCKSLPQYSMLLWCSNITIYKKRKVYIIYSLLRIYSLVYIFNPFNLFDRRVVNWWRSKWIHR